MSAALEAEVARLKADLERERAIADDLRAQVRVFMARMEAETSQRTARMARNARHRSKGVSMPVSADVSSASHETSQSPSPPPPSFSLSPPSKPSSPILYPSPSTPPRTDPPKAPKGAREPREGDPCEPHTPPRTAPAAARLAQDTFAPPDTSEQVFQDLHSALSVKFQIRHGRPMTWSPGNEDIHRRLLHRAERDGFSGKQAVEEVAKRYGHMLVRLDRPYEPGKFKGATLEALAKPEVWAGNALAPPPERRPTSQGPAMSAHDWETLPPTHQATIDAQLPPEPI